MTLTVSEGDALQVISRPTDYIGKWRIQFTNCVLGSNSLSSFSVYGSIHTSENNWGSFQCVTQFPITQTLYNNPLFSDLEKTNLQVTAPTLATVAVINATTAIPFLGFLPYLAYMFSEPFAIIFRKRRKSWGVVYDSITKQPLDLVVVRLYDLHTKKLIETRVTDRYGRYNFVLNPGRYYLLAQKAEFSFPSIVLANKAEDAKYNKLYHGEEIIIRNEGKTLINYNIPLDVKKEFKDNKSILFGYILHQTQRSIALIGPVFALITFLITPNWIFFSLLMVHSGLYTFFRRISHTTNLKTYGIIKEARTGKPVKNAIVKLFDVDHNKLLETKITTNKGQYNFLVGENTYYMSIEKDGYKTFISPIITVPKGEDGIISKDIKIKTL